MASPLTKPVEERWWAVDVACHPTLLPAALWRLAGPGHRCCAVRQASDGCCLWAFLARSETEPAEIGRMYVGLRLDAQARGLSPPRVAWRLTRSWDWPDEYKEETRAQLVGERLLIAPPWCPAPEDDRIVLRIDSRFGFGSGAHPTTTLCLEVLERRLSGDIAVREVTLADIGCGSGILSIGALRLGATRVYAVDTKLAAVQGTAANAELNGLAPGRLRVAQGGVATLEEMLPGPVDGVVCNIRVQVIIGLVSRLAAIVKPGGWGVLSGVLDAELPELRSRLTRHGWDAVRVSHRDGWCCVEVQRGT